MKKQLFGPDHLSLAESYFNLSNVYLLETKIEKMIEILQLSLTIFLKNNHIELITFDVYNFLLLNIYNKV